MLYLKKFACILNSIVIIALYFVVYTRPFLFEYADKITIHTKNGSFTDGMQVVNIGEYFGTDKIYGESAIIDGASVYEIFEEFDATIIKTEELDGVTCYYGYSSRFPYEVKLFGEKINLHVAVEGEKTILGMPLIFGSF